MRFILNNNLNKLNILFGLAIIVLISSLLFPKYINYCKKCGQTCALFTGKSLGNCISSCWCPNIKPDIGKHVDDYSTFDSEKDICSNGYSPPPIVHSKDDQNKINNSKPNIVLFVVDDLDELISPYMEAMKFTKELFKLNGTHFSNGYTSTSYCCPARCQIFSGLYPHNNGVLGMHGKYGSIHSFRKPHHLNGTRMKDTNGKCINNENRAINLLLKKYAGYHTSIIGKYLNGIEHETTRHIDYVPPGWDEFHVGSDPYMYGGYRYTLSNWSSDDSIVNYRWYSVNEEDYVTDVIKDKTLNIINKHKTSKQSKKPMFLYVATTAPHLPMPCAERHRDKQEYWRNYYDTYVSNRPNYNVKTDSEPDWFNKHSRRNGLVDEGLNWNKLEWEKRMCSLYAVDELIEATYNELKKYNQHTNTVFGFVSDNGYNLGAHGLFNKLAPYDESIRIPFYLSGPTIQKNYIDDRIVALIDLPSTFLDVANLQIPSYMNGLSLVDPNIKLNDRKTLLFQFKNNLDYVHHDHIDFSPELEFIRPVIPKWMMLDFHPYVGIRTKEFMYAEHNVDGNYTDYELYDMRIDKYQITNLYKNSSYDDIKQSLAHKLKVMQNCTGIYCRT